MSTTTNTNTATPDGSTNVDGEPPRKRMKVNEQSESQLPVPAPPGPPTDNTVNTNGNTSSYPKFLPTISPLDYDDEDENTQNSNSLGLDCTVAPLPEATEEWPLCANCGKGGDLSRCSSCRQSYYCNRECQVTHWDVHCIVCQPGPPQPAVLSQGVVPVKPAAVFPVQNGYGGGYGGNYNGGNYNGSYGSMGGVNGITGVTTCTPVPHRPRGRPKGTRNSTKKTPRTPRRKHFDGPAANGQYVCPYCSREFSNGNALGGHISGAHTKKARREAERRAQYEQSPGNYAAPTHQPPVASTAGRMY